MKPTETGALSTLDFDPSGVGDSGWSEWQSTLLSFALECALSTATVVSFAALGSHLAFIGGAESTSGGLAWGEDRPVGTTGLGSALNSDLVVGATVLGEEWMSLDVSALGLGKNGNITLSSCHGGGGVRTSLGAGGALDGGGGVSETMRTLAVSAHLVSSADNLILANVDNFGHSPTTLVSDIET